MKGDVITPEELELASYKESDANLRKRVEELEAIIEADGNLARQLLEWAELKDTIAELEAKHTALVDGLRELADEWRTISYKTTDAYTNLHGCADELEATFDRFRRK